MRRFAGLFMAACLAVSVPAASAVYAEEVNTEINSEASVEETVGTSDELNVALSIDGVTLPNGTEQITYNYHGTAIQAAKTATGLYVLPVTQADGTVKWYVYNEETDKAIPYIEFAGVDVSYVIVSPDADVEVPKGYEPVDINIGTEPMPAWYNKNSGDPNMYLIYAMDSQNNEGFYRFDGTNGNALRFVEDVVEPDETTTAEPTPDPSMEAEITRYSNAAAMANQNYTSLQNKHNQEMLIGLITLGVLALVAIVLFIMIISSSSKLKKAKRKIAEQEKARAAAEARSRHNGKVRPKGTRVVDSMEDTRLKDGREEGTSKVRRVSRPVRPEFEETTTTSRVKVAKPAEGKERVRKPAEAAQSPAKKRPADAQKPPVKKRPSEIDETKQSVKAERPAEEKQAKEAEKPSGETRIFDKAPAAKVKRPKIQELEDLDDILNDEAEVAVNTAAEAEEEIETAGDEVFRRTEEAVKPQPEETEEDTEEDAESVDEADYAEEDDEDDDIDFDLTDFKDI